jgi:hypothetical protein
MWFILANIIILIVIFLFSWFICNKLKKSIIITIILYFLLITWLRYYNYRWLSIYFKNWLIPAITNIWNSKDVYKTENWYIYKKCSWGSVVLITDECPRVCVENIDCKWYCPKEAISSICDTNKNDTEKYCRCTYGWLRLPDLR